MTKTLNVTLEQSLINYAAAGFAVFPVDGKIPAVKRWQHTAHTLDLKLKPFEGKNAGVVLKDEDLILDFDPRNFPVERKDTIVQFLKACGFRKGFPFVYVATGGGGYHFYFKKPSELQFKKAHANWPGVDVLSRGRFVVAADSIHPDTHNTYVLVGELSAIPQMPECALAYLRETYGAPAIVPNAAPVDPLVDNSRAAQEIFSTYLRSDAPVAVEGANGDQTTYTVACHGKDLGLSESVTFELMCKHYNPLCKPHWPADELLEKVRHAYKYSQNSQGVASISRDFKVVDAAGDEVKLLWDLNASGVAKTTIRNTVNHIISGQSELRGAMAFNELTQNIVWLRPAPWMHPSTVIPRGGLPWSDADVAQCRYYLNQKHNYVVSADMVLTAFENVARFKPFHPIREWLLKLKWDGQPRLDTWLPQCVMLPDTPYARGVGVMMLIAACKRVFYPGCKYDYTPILGGVQRIGKSRLCAAIGGEYYADITLDPGNKDTVDAMRGKWIIEISEMECTKRAEVMALKAFLSRSTDRIRLPYARATQDIPRQSTFIGTINPEDSGYLRDTTGNTRFWPLYCKRVNVDLFIANRDQLFAEAYARLSATPVLDLIDDSAREQAIEEQHKRMLLPAFADRLAIFVAQHKDQKFISTRQLWEEALGGSPSRFNLEAQSNISRVMQSYRWKRGRFQDTDGSNQRGFYRPESEGTHVD